MSMYQFIHKQFWHQCYHHLSRICNSTTSPKWIQFPFFHKTLRFWSRSLPLVRSPPFVRTTNRPPARPSFRSSVRSFAYSLVCAHERARRWLKSHRARFLSLFISLFLSLLLVLAHLFSLTRSHSHSLALSMCVLCAQCSSEDTDVINSIQYKSYFHWKQEKPLVIPMLLCRYKIWRERAPRSVRSRAAIQPLELSSK